MSVRSAFTAHPKDDEYTVAEDESLGNRGVLGELTDEADARDRGVLGELTDEADARDRRDLMACRGQLAECEAKIANLVESLEEKENECVTLRSRLTKCMAQLSKCRAEYATCKAARETCERELAECRAKLD